MGCGAGPLELSALELPDTVEQLDAQLARVVREDAALRLRLGQVLEVMQREAHHFNLGFSSLSAYALERCERGARWVETACCLARRLEALPLLRHALATGRISWSMAELTARAARSEDEAAWLDLAQQRTLRKMRDEVRSRQGSAEIDAALTRDCEARCTLTCTLDREDAWLLEATRALLDQFGTRGTEDQLEALLAEAQGALLAALPAGAALPEAMDLDEQDRADEAQRRWREQLARWQSEAEERCEPRIRAAVLERAAPTRNEVALQAARGLGSLEGWQSRELDAFVQQLAAALAGHELSLSRLLWRFHRADGWRRLGYATEAQYARERLGLSRSSVIARRMLALRLEALPHIASALSRAELGVEAALQLVRIATPRTELAWLERARQRTVKHLREEVAAALVAVRHRLPQSGEADCPPPEVSELEAFQELERAALSGRLGGGTPNLPQPGCTLEPGVTPPGDSRHASLRQPWRAMLGSLTAWLAGGTLEHAVQLSAPNDAAAIARGVPTCGPGDAGAFQAAVQLSAPSAARSFSKRTRSAGRVELRWRVSLELRGWWHALETRARRFLPRSVGWVRYLCLVFWRAWGHMVGPNVAWGQVYLRDRWRCSSPVCSRRDVTPHHLQFRSAGGSDEDENMTSLCSWCHLFGVHGGRIRATGSARHIVWELGSREQPCLRVEGRQRLVTPRAHQAGGRA